MAVEGCLLGFESQISCSFHDHTNHGGCSIDHLSDPKITSEFLHNLAIDFWITANCTWMIGEFFGWDEGLVGAYGLREFSLIPFSIGLLVLGYYYLIYMHKKDFEEKVLSKPNN